MSESFPPECRLRRPRQFQRCYRAARRRGRLLMVASAPNDLGVPRLGLTASRKVGRAHVRNRLKRWVRETFRRHEVRSELGGRDVVVHFFPAARDAAFREVEREAVAQMRRLSRPGRRSRGGR